MSEFEEELSNLKVSKSENDTEYYNKSQLLTVFKNWQPPKPQQALPVVPECVAEWIEDVKEQDYNALELLYIHDMPNSVYDWLFKRDDDYNINIILRAWLYGYTVEKQQLFYLREKNTGYYLRKTGNDVYGITPHYSNDCYEKYITYKFTQQEIDSMETGSYEQIEVEE